MPTAEFSATALFIKYYTYADPYCVFQIHWTVVWLIVTETLNI